MVDESELLYERVAAGLLDQLDGGIYGAGERLPGVRRLSAQLGVSISTVIEALRLLEDQGRVESRPRSGYYVRTAPRRLPAEPEISVPRMEPVRVTGQELALRVIRATSDPAVVQLGAAVPDSSFLPTRAVQRALAAAARRTAAMDYQFSPGHPELRRQLARRMALLGCRLTADEIVVTDGCQEALGLALRAVATPGAVVAIESPTFYGLLQVIESSGLEALEIPTHPREGMSLDALRLALEQWPIQAVVAIPHFSNPLGYCMSEARKRALVELLAAHRIPLIEDDVYGDLGFAQRPRAAKRWDREGNVLYCSSFSKSLAPGLRVGWIAAGRFRDRVEHLKYVLNIAGAAAPQLAVAQLLEQGGYDRYLRQVRGQYARAVARMIDAVGRWFPAGTRVTRPEGGFVLWAELPARVKALELQKRAFAEGIAIMPGPLFSPSGRYRNCIRLNAARVWDDRLERALVRLGALAQEQIGAESATRRRRPGG